MDEEMLKFAYKYSFSEEAKEIVREQKNASYEDKYATAALLRVNEDLEKERPEFIETSYPELMFTYLMSYVYARMLVSANGNMYVIKKFASAEAERAADALAKDSLENMIKLAKELNIDIELSNAAATISVWQFLKLAKDAGLRLVHMRLGNGKVEIERNEIISLMKGAMLESIMKGLPIAKEKLPKEIFSYADKISLPKPKVEAGTNEKYAWIEKLLATPIPDARHRTVNLILAPYLTNVKGLDPEAAANIIIDYIEKCKQLNPNTRINDAYIRYQCKYAKEHGLRPLSLARAKELFKGILEL